MADDMADDIADEDEALEAGYRRLAESHADDHDELRELRDRALRRYGRA